MVRTHVMVTPTVITPLVLLSTPPPFVFFSPVLFCSLLLNQFSLSTMATWAFFSNNMFSSTSQVIFTDTSVPPLQLSSWRQPQYAEFLSFSAWQVALNGIRDHYDRISNAVRFSSLANTNALIRVVTVLHFRGVWVVKFSWSHTWMRAIHRKLLVGGLSLMKLWCCLLYTSNAADE